jgi:hypothetical protein
MKLTVKATVLILLVSLLSGCSSAEAKACKLAVETQADYLKQSKTLMVKSSQQKIENPFNARSLFDTGQNIFLKSQKVIVNNPQCFTPKQVVEAQTSLGK